MARKGSVPQFARSPELKRLYNEHFERWCKKHRLGAAELAERCGVSLQYLSHVGRYGRVPGRPILLLLALNLELDDPQRFLAAADVREPWPFEPTVRLRAGEPQDRGFISMHVDMPGFTNAIREIVRAELSPRSPEQLLGGGTVRIGLNRGQSFLFDAGGGKSGPHGFFPELVRLLCLALRATPEFVEVPHSSYSSRLEEREIDLYGPLYLTPARLGQALHTRAFCTVQLAALARKKAAKGLEDLSPPRTLKDLTRKPYQIAVHADSMSHHFLLGELRVPPERVIPCEAVEESIERILLANIPRPAHVLLTDAPHAGSIAERYGKSVERLFEPAEETLPVYEDVIAVRDDWQPVCDALSDALEFMQRNGTTNRLRESHLAAEFIAAVRSPGR